MNPPTTEYLWHVTVLSNFARGYDKYARIYSKAGIPESRFPDRFFLLRPNELDVGIRKSGALLRRMALPGNRLLALRTAVQSNRLNLNVETGLGRFVQSAAITVDGLAFIDGDACGGQLVPVAVEEATAMSLRLLWPRLPDYEQLKPRSFSLLPIARGCQASCPFCFSDASASAEQEQAQLNVAHVRSFAIMARSRGAERFVITGGGEPGLVRHELLRTVIATGHDVLGKTVLITNGHHLSRQTPDALAATLEDYAGAGLSVLSVSRHHHEDDASERLMRLRTNVAGVVDVWHAGQAHWPGLTLRLTCVLQRGSVDRLATMESYVDWAVELGVSELCFKELYVSTSVESVYHRHAANEWSHANQVPLALVLEFAALHGFVETARLPWGSPIFSGEWRGKRLRFAAYTEPSLLWERAHGIARSWNLMSDGRCLASLEDRASEVLPPVAA
jgi:pyruvate-formate lyase-activating enzyme